MRPAPDRQTNLTPSLSGVLGSLLGRPPSDEEMQEARLRLRMIAGVLRAIATRLEAQSP